MLRTGLKPTGSVFGKRLREARVRAGLTQDGLGVAIGLDVGPACIRISRYESGVHSPSLDVLFALAQELDVPAGYLVTADDALAERMLRVAALKPASARRLDEWLASPKGPVGGVGPGHPGR